MTITSINGVVAVFKDSLTYLHDELCVKLDIQININNNTAYHNVTFCVSMTWELLFKYYKHLRDKIFSRDGIINSDNSAVFPA